MSKKIHVSETHGGFYVRHPDRLVRLLDSMHEDGWAFEQQQEYCVNLGLPLDLFEDAYRTLHKKLEPVPASASMAPLFEFRKAQQEGNLLEYYNRQLDRMKYSADASDTLPFAEIISADDNCQRIRFYHPYEIAGFSFYRRTHEYSHKEAEVLRVTLKLDATVIGSVTLLSVVWSEKLNVAHEGRCTELMARLFYRLERWLTHHPMA